MGRGGDGLSSSITGSKTFYAGGGGGSNYQSTTAETHPPGGVGGGGVGDSYTTPLNSSQRSGAANTGGGGGGAERNPSGDATGGSGGSGVVIVRYRGPQKATGGDSIYEQDGYTVHVFNNSANFVVGSTAGDISYNENAGVLNNGATFNSANGGSFDFDGTDDHIEIPSIGSALLEYSFSFFIKWNSITASGSRCFGLPTYGTYTILNSSDVGYHYNPLGGVPASTTISSGVNAGLNNWVHVCVTESRTNSQAKIYINGVEKGNSNLVSSSGFVGNITLGGQHKPSPNNLNADCNISLFLVYNKVLTAAEVAQNFAATRGRFGI
jgi:hypothetical protein